MPTPPLILASTSPRRREILRSIGVRFELHAVDIDESPAPGESPECLAERLAVGKAEADDLEGFVLGADTVVALDGHLLGKPVDEEDAVSMLLALSGRCHRVVTGVALHTPKGTGSVVSSTEVRFRDIDRDEAIAYWHSGEPRDKAGGYGIQGLGGIFVESIRGSYSGVMGLPVFETVGLLRTAGVEVLGKAQ